MAVIIADSTCDLSVAQAQALQIELLSLKVSFGLETFEDKRDISNEAFFERLVASRDLPTTSLLSVGDFLAAFEKHRDEPIVVLTLSAQLSGTWNSAQLAKEETGRDDIYVVDTGMTTSGMGILVLLAAQLRDEGMTACDIAARITEKSRKARYYIILNTLHYLVKGGRLSGAQGAIGGMLSLKPIVTIENGGLRNVAKARGMQAAISALGDLVRAGGEVDMSLPICYAHSGAVPMMHQLMAQLALPATAGEYYIGSVVGTYAGPGAAAVAFFVK